MRYKIVFSYDGSNFAGYQVQPGLRTIQGELEKALFHINNHTKTPVQASGRTDKGVHALEQVAHVDLDISITEKKLKRALNSNLPEDIHVISTKAVEKDFHARYSVLEKEYHYLLNVGEYNPLERNYVYQCCHPLNVEAMKEAIQVFLGEHDFRAFVTENSDKENCIRTIYEVNIEEVEKEKYRISFRGTGFLRYQVRNMVGILLKVGENKLSTKDVENYLEGKNRSKGGVTAPAEGLYLVKVTYEGDKTH